MKTETVTIRRVQSRILRAMLPEGYRPVPTNMLPAHLQGPAVSRWAVVGQAWGPRMGMGTFGYGKDRIEAMRNALALFREESFALSI